MYVHVPRCTRARSAWGKRSSPRTPYLDQTRRTRPIADLVDAPCCRTMPVLVRHRAINADPSYSPGPVPHKSLLSKPTEERERHAPHVKPTEEREQHHHQQARDAGRTAEMDVPNDNHQSRHSSPSLPQKSGRAASTVHSPCVVSKWTIPCRTLAVPRPFAYINKPYLRSCSRLSYSNFHSPNSRVQPSHLPPSLFRPIPVP